MIKKIKCLNVHARFKIYLINRDEMIINFDGMIIVREIFTIFEL